MTQRTAIFPAGRTGTHERNKYSAAVASGGLLFVSGQVGSKDDGSPHADPEAQRFLAASLMCSAAPSLVWLLAARVRKALARRC